MLTPRPNQAYLSWIIARNVWRLLEARGMTLTELGAGMTPPISVASLSNMMRTPSGLRASLLMEIADVLNAPVEEFFAPVEGGDKPPTSHLPADPCVMTSYTKA